MNVPIGIAVAALMLGLFIGAVVSSRPRPEPRLRFCSACGHERGWHQTYWRTSAREPWLGCSHPYTGLTRLQCNCPAGRRSIR